MGNRSGLAPRQTAGGDGDLRRCAIRSRTTSFTLVGQSDQSAKSICSVCARSDAFQYCMSVITLSADERLSASSKLVRAAGQGTPAFSQARMLAMDPARADLRRIRCSAQPPPRPSAEFHPQFGQRGNSLPLAFRGNSVRHFGQTMGRGFNESGSSRNATNRKMATMVPIITSRRFQNTDALSLTGSDASQLDVKRRFCTEFAT